MNTLANLILMMILQVLSVGVFSVLLLHVELLRLVPSDEHLGELVLGPKGSTLTPLGPICLAHSIIQYVISNVYDGQDIDTVGLVGICAVGLSN